MKTEQQEEQVGGREGLLGSLRRNRGRISSSHYLHHAAADAAANDANLASVSIGWSDRHSDSFFARKLKIIDLINEALRIVEQAHDDDDDDVSSKYDIKTTE